MAAASANSALDNVESAPGRASSQDVESLSLWRQAHADLSFLGLWLSRDLARRSARVFSLELVIFFLVSPLTEPFPSPASYEKEFYKHLARPGLGSALARRHYVI